MVNSEGFFLRGFPVYIYRRGVPLSCNHEDKPPLKLGEVPTVACDNEVIEELVSSSQYHIYHSSEQLSWNTRGSWKKPGGKK